MSKNKLNKKKKKISIFKNNMIYKFNNYIVIKGCKSKKVNFTTKDMS
jgi:hypothetical protein